MLDQSWRAGYLDNGRDELQQEARHPQQSGVEGVQKVHNEALDVAAVVVLHSDTPPTEQITKCTRINDKDSGTHT